MNANKYFIFSYDGYYPCGGFNDFVMIVEDNSEEAVLAALKEYAAEDANYMLGEHVQVVPYNVTKDIFDQIEYYAVKFDSYRGTIREIERY